MSSTLGNDPELAAQSLAKLWPNRLYESNFFKNMFCRVGLQDWVQLDLRELVQGKDVRFCRSCSDVEIDGEIYSG
jgi:hypothetical protein